MADTLKSSDVPEVHGMVVVNPDGTTISGGGGGTAAYSDSSDVSKKGLVDGDRHVQVDVLTMPGVTVDTTGLATEIKQDALLTELQLKADLTETQPVSMATNQPSGNVASGATDSGNPIKIGGIYNSTKPTFTNGQRGDAQLSTRGSLIVQLSSPDGINSPEVATTSNDAESNSTGATTAKFGVQSWTKVFNGSTWDRLRGMTATLNAAATGLLASAMVGQYDDTSPTTITENNFGAVRMSSNRNVYATIRDAAGNERGLNIDASGNLGLSAGTNTIGSVKSVPSDIDINGANANHADKYYSSTGAVADGIVWSPATGKRWHVLTLYINVSAAATVTIEDDLAGGDVVRWKGELAANSGVILKYDKEHPFCSGEDAADLLITTSAGNVYVQAVGYEV